MSYSNSLPIHDNSVLIPCFAASSSSYSPLPDDREVSPNRWRSIKPFLFSIVLSLSAAVLLLLMAQGLSESEHQQRRVLLVEDASSRPVTRVLPRGVAEGVSAKSVLMFLNPNETYPWTNSMLRWQRTAFHFQPEKNWMNGPLFYKGWYHIFYNYNPNSAVWGNITWGHAISRDLINWLLLPPALFPDQWYDINGVWTGSATLLPNGSVVMLYTGSIHDQRVQVQNLAFPADPSDPLLLNWVKYHHNPILLPPPGIGSRDFRDPSTAWSAPDGTWRIAIGSKWNTTGISLVYKTSDFLSYELLDTILHAVHGTGMWECVELFPVSLTGDSGLDTSANGPGVKHVLKASIDDERHDYYAIGMYDVEKGTWTPDDAVEDVGIGIRYDFGKYYASKSFYDPEKKRRVLWAYVGETDSELADVAKGWACVQAIPRVVSFDAKTGSNLLQWPVNELEELRTSCEEFKTIELHAGSVIPLEVAGATQVDITAEFKMAKEALEETIEADVNYNCSTSGGASGRGMLGPFGLLVLADQGLSEQTAVYFYVGRGADGNLQTFFCQDESRSSKANDTVKRLYGSTVPVLDGENFTLRILVDHSIVESFAQGGRRCITSRVYPTEAIYGAARLFLFNNATRAHVTATTIKIWQMNSASIHSYPDGLESS
ncbi:Glycoside hydrolase [Cinnamomum micranthum f. kanehirae]|uniref:Glycoside hydrolase n=1 Tax=Cinnamomum micranthum f. kanehirae TaxID=337451 RepID=A0A3S3MZI5_9MAGN|nr:Glycoside hydrolase [Cinnamomum micranthum f. kanehirae]